jgi:hypothetical protein
MDLLSAVRFAVLCFARLALFTDNPYDDRLAAFAQAQLDNPDFVAWLESLLNADHEEHMFGAAADGSAPPSVMAAAGALNIDWQKFLSETLPKILALIKMFTGK